MKRFLMIFIAMMMTASCSLAQSELPKLMLKDIADQSKVTYEMEGGAVYESGTEGSDAYLYAWYNDFGDLDYYIYNYDCGCEVWYEGSGRIDRPNSNNQCDHTAPVKHAYQLKLLDENLTQALKALTGKTYSLEYLKDPVEMGELTRSEDGKVFILEDKGYDAVAMRGRSSARYQAESFTEGGKKYWKAVFKREESFKDAQVIIKMDGKLSYLRSDGSVIAVELGDYCEYDANSDTFWVNGGYRFNSFADYDGNGNMYEYGYHKSGDIEYSRVHYDMQNVLTYASFDDTLGRSWFYTMGQGWLLYDEENDTDVETTPDAIALASVLPPVRIIEDKKEPIVIKPIVSDQIGLSKNTLELVKEQNRDLALKYANAGVNVEKAFLEKIGAFDAGMVELPSFEPKAEISLNVEQKKTVEGMQTAGFLSPELIVDGKEVSSFGGETLVPYIEFTPPAGTSGSEWTVVQLLDDGGIEVQPTTYKDGKLHVTFTHFSDYAIVRLNGAAPDLPSTGDNSSLMLWLGMLMISLCAYAAGRKVRA